MNDAVGVDVESDLNLRQASGLGARCVRLSAKRLVVGGHFTLTLQNVNFNLGLPRRQLWSKFGFLGRNRGIALISLLNTPPSVSMPRERA
jgi:hypothetical protein